MRGGPIRARSAHAQLGLYRPRAVDDDDAAGIRRPDRGQGTPSGPVAGSGPLAEGAGQDAVDIDARDVTGQDHRGPDRADGPLVERHQVLATHAGHGLGRARSGP